MSATFHDGCIVGVGDIEYRIEGAALSQGAAYRVNCFRNEDNLRGSHVDTEVTDTNIAS
jgi:hypothetical protein